MKWYLDYVIIVNNETIIEHHIKGALLGSEHMYHRVTSLMISKPVRELKET